MSYVRNISGIEVTFKEKSDLKLTHLVYLLTFSNGKCYVGQTKRDLSHRIEQACCEKHMKVATPIQEFKKFKVEVLCSNLNNEDMDLVEAYYIKLLNTTNEDYGYNNRKGQKSGLYLFDKNKRKLITWKIISFPDSIVFNSIADCAEYYGILTKDLSYYCYGELHKPSNQTFKLLDECHYHF